MTDAEYDLVKARSFFNKKTQNSVPIDIKRSWHVVEGAFVLDPDQEYDCCLLSCPPPSVGSWAYDTLSYMVFPPDDSPYVSYAIKDADDRWLEIVWPDGDE